LKELIAAIRKHDPSVHSVLEVFLYPGLWAMFFHAIASRLFNMRLYFLARFVCQFSRFITGIEIHPGARIGKGVFIDHGAGVVIGETCVIGDNVVIYQGVTLGGTGKDTGKRHPTVEKDAMISAGAKVIGPITVGAGAKIGAGAVVLRDVPAGHTMVGEPSRNTAIEDSLRKEVLRLKQQIEELTR